MFWMLFRALCCLCSNRQALSQGNGYYYYHQDDSDDDDDDDDDDSDKEKEEKEKEEEKEEEKEQTDATTRARVVKLSKLKRNAIDVTTDVIVAESMLRQHGNDSSLLMYHDRCSQEMYRALNKLPVTSHGVQVKGPYSPHRKTRLRHAIDIV